MAGSELWAQGEAELPVEECGRGKPLRTWHQGAESSAPQDKHNPKARPGTPPPATHRPSLWSPPSGSMQVDQALMKLQLSKPSHLTLGTVLHGLTCEPGGLTSRP